MNDSIRKHALLAIVLLVAGVLFVPAVSAIDITSLPYTDTQSSQTFGYAESSIPNYVLWGGGKYKGVFSLKIDHVENFPNVHYFRVETADGSGIKKNIGTEGYFDVWYSRPSDGSYQKGVIQNQKVYNALGQVTKTYISFWPTNWDVGTKTGGWNTVIYADNNGVKSSEAIYTAATSSEYGPAAPTLHDGESKYSARLYMSYNDITLGNSYAGMKTHAEAYSDTWHKLQISQNYGSYTINLNRIFEGKPYNSVIAIYNALDELRAYNAQSTNYESVVPVNDVDKIVITSGTDTYTYNMIPAGSDTPIPPHVVSNRTGTVTMTDNNGTTITGFEVSAVNAYTGQSYTVSTDTDVAIISLPMDRTIEIRNPQTGVYEEAPIGYYRFFGQSPGYKMLHEDGIQVSVMPEKYGSYQLCDIRVTQESGYLTGKHQFQIRSRSDHSILQTGTISAKSATTGEWYNATVSGGIATLILPYDTSNVVSQYAGNYYVYATSPGYEDSDYGTQIVVMPHTTSEIHSIQLTPIGGVPTAGNVTLRIQAFSETGSGIPNAEIFIAGVLGAGSDVWNTYIASSTGYLTVSVPGNSTYDIVASGAGYYDSARRVQVFDDDPGLIEIKLYLSGAPTVPPTTQPTGWVTPTPTQTTPPIQEDNIIGLSVKGLAKGFGIDYDTALLMFGFMIIFGAGGMVMSSVKGGAMEFIAGSIVGTFVAFALGLIPIWIFIIIAVVFGAYVLRVFVQGGQ